MKQVMRQKQLVATAIALVLGIGAIAWLGLASLGERQGEAQALAELMGNPVLAALLNEPDGARRASKDASEIQKLTQAIQEKDGDSTRWSAATKELGGDGADWAKDPGKWKDRLIVIQSQLQKEAKASRIKLAPDFYLGLDGFRQKSPSVQEVPDLALQLSVAERLVRLLMEARKIKEQYPTICEILALFGPGSDKTKGIPEVANPLSVSVGKTGLPMPAFERKPFRVEIRSSPEVLYEYVRLLTTDPALLIVMDLKVTNEKQAFPVRSEIAKKFSDASSGSEKSEEKKSANRLLEILAGEEAVITTLHIDFVAWRNSEEAKPGKTPSPNP